MGNKPRKSNDTKEQLEDRVRQIEDILGSATPTPASVSSSKVPRKSFLVAPPTQSKANLERRWDCDRCGVSNNGTTMVCVGCKDIRC